MPIPVIMPKLEMSQETALLVEWLKQEGETVKNGEPIMTVETDKVTIEIESPGEGILRGIAAKPGETVPVTKVIAYLYHPDEEPLPTENSPLDGEAPDAPSTAIPGGEKTGGKITPVAVRMAAVEGINLSDIIGSGPDGRIQKSDIKNAIRQQFRASPAARRIARENDMSLSQVQGSGPKNRIQGHDVFQAMKPITPTSLPTTGTPESIQFSGMRKTIAERMLASYQSTPHVSFTSRVDLTAIGLLRSLFNEKSDRSQGSHVSLTVLFVKIVATVLREHRLLNSSFRGDDYVIWPDINIGIAVALAAGLIVPVIRNADSKTISELAGEVANLVGKAHQNKLQPVDVADGTFTITNLGPYGIEQFNAIINPGQAAILAIGASTPEAIPVDGRAEIREVLRMTLSVDHRVIDGAVAAKFMKDLKTALEFPSIILR